MMRLLEATLAAQIASAAVIPRQYAPCSFQLNAVGFPTTVFAQQLATGQIGIDADGSEFYFINQTLYDSSNNNCNIAADSSLTCTATTTPSNFSVSDYGNLLYGSADSDAFLACSTNGTYSIFSTAKTNATNCTPITLRQGGFNCTALGGRSLSTSTALQLQPRATTNTTTCPADLSAGTFISPHLLVPTSSKSPNTSFGPSGVVYITPINTTLYTFTLPSTLNPVTYSLIFLFPYKSDLYNSTNTYLFSGIEEEEEEKGGIDFALLSTVASATTTYTSIGAVQKEFGTTEVLPGNNYTVGSFTSGGGEVSISGTSVGNVELDYGQDERPVAMGLYVVAC